jgi:hypothetical protein
MKLLTKAIEKQLPSFDELNNKFESNSEHDPMCYVKYFDPTGSWTWWGYAYDPDTRIMTGLVKGFETEQGDFSLTELEQIRIGFGLGIERDLHFEPMRLSEILNNLEE